MPSGTPTHGELAPNNIRVKLVKQKHGGLGFLVKQRTLKPFVLVASIVAGGVAEESGLVQVGTSTLVILISVPPWYSRHPNKCAVVTASI